MSVVVPVEHGVFELPAQVREALAIAPCDAIVWHRGDRKLSITRLAAATRRRTRRRASGRTVIVRLRRALPSGAQDGGPRHAQEPPAADGEPPSNLR